jgi:hypothetical protein
VKKEEIGKGHWQGSQQKEAFPCLEEKNFSKSLQLFEEEELPLVYNPGGKKVIYYLDTSVLVKRYYTEKGSAYIHELFQPENLLNTRLASSQELTALPGLSLGGTRVSGKGYGTR